MTRCCPNWYQRLSRRGGWYERGGGWCITLVILSLEIVYVTMLVWLDICRALGVLYFDRSSYKHPLIRLLRVCFYIVRPAAVTIIGLMALGRFRWFIESVSHYMGQVRAEESVCCMKSYSE